MGDLDDVEAGVVQKSGQGAVRKEADMLSIDREVFLEFGRLRWRGSSPRRGMACSARANRREPGRVGLPGATPAVPEMLDQLK